MRRGGQRAAGPCGKGASGAGGGRGKGASTASRRRLVCGGGGTSRGEPDLRKQSTVPEGHEAVHQRRRVAVQRLDETGAVLEEQREPRRRGPVCGGGGVPEGAESERDIPRAPSDETDGEEAGGKGLGRGTRAVHARGMHAACVWHVYGACMACARHVQGMRTPRAKQTACACACMCISREGLPRGVALPRADVLAPLLRARHHVGCAVEVVEVVE